MCRLENAEASGKGERVALLAYLIETRNGRFALLIPPLADCLARSCSLSTYLYVTQNSANLQHTAGL